jgi:hypothetical protein
VKSGCTASNNPTQWAGVWADAYAAQFNPMDPNTWQSGLVWYNLPASITNCQGLGTCPQHIETCYTMPCWGTEHTNPATDSCGAGHGPALPWCRMLCRNGDTVGKVPVPLAWSCSSSRSAGMATSEDGCPTLSANTYDFMSGDLVVLRNDFTGPSTARVVAQTPLGAVTQFEQCIEPGQAGLLQTAQVTSGATLSWSTPGSCTDPKSVKAVGVHLF